MHSSVERVGEAGYEQWSLDLAVTASFAQKLWEMMGCGRVMEQEQGPTLPKKAH